MQLSELQRYILKKTYVHGPRCSRSVFDTFYRTLTEEAHNAITRSIERLVVKGMLVSYGKKTAQKWFTDTVSLTPKGRNMVLTRVIQQTRLPLILQKSKRKRGGSH